MFAQRIATRENEIMEWDTAAADYIDWIDADRISNYNYVNRNA